MSFSIVTDTSANLPRQLIEQHNLTVIPFSYFVDHQEHTCIAPEDYDGQAYFASLAKGLQVTTSLVPPQRYIDHLEPLLAQEQDILLVSMSSGISGSFDSAQSAAAQLRQKYPARSIPGWWTAWRVAGRGAAGAGRHRRPGRRKKPGGNRRPSAHHAGSDVPNLYGGRSGQSAPHRKNLRRGGGAGVCAAYQAPAQGQRAW